MVIAELGMGQALVELQSRDHHLQVYGNVHGGVIASLADTAIFWSCFAELDETVGITTVDLKVNYRRPLRKGNCRRAASGFAWAAPWASARRRSSTARASSLPTGPPRHRPVRLRVSRQPETPAEIPVDATCRNSPIPLLPTCLGGHKICMFSCSAAGLARGATATTFHPVRLKTQQVKNVPCGGG